MKTARRDLLMKIVDPPKVQLTGPKHVAELEFRRHFRRMVPGVWAAERAVMDIVTDAVVMGPKLDRWFTHAELIEKTESVHRQMCVFLGIPINEFRPNPRTGGVTPRILAPGTPELCDDKDCRDCLNHYNDLLKNWSRFLP